MTKRQSELAMERTAVALGTVDITPTWEALMPTIIAALQDGTPAGQQIAGDELMRLARFADRFIARNKS